MEANIKENQITFSKGMSNVPSDNLCDDNCLSDCVGLRMKDGELKAVQKPMQLGTLEGCTLMYVHKTASYKHLIYTNDKNDSRLMWIDTDADGKITGDGNVVGDDSNNISGGIEKIASIGNTLIINTQDGIKYALWKDNKYTLIGDLPDVVLHAKAGDSVIGTTVPDGYESDASKEKAMETLRLGMDVSGNQEQSVYDASKSEVIGLIEGAYKKMLREGYFTYPFWLRAALLLKDGSYVRITPPLVVYPSVRKGAFIKATSSVYHDVSGVNARSIDKDFGCNYGSKIMVNLEVPDLSPYTDIVDKVVIFASDQVKTWNDDGTGYDGNKVIYDHLNGEGSYGSLEADTTFVEESKGLYGLLAIGISDTSDNLTKAGTLRQTLYFLPPGRMSDDEIADKLVRTSVFYKVAEMSAVSSDLNKYVDLGGLMDETVRTTLTEQEQLPHDDYYGHCKMTCGSMFTYNNRIQIADIRRYPWQGTYYLSNKDINYTKEFEVTIHGQDGSTLKPKVTTGYDTQTPYFPQYFFYPDPNAVSVSMNSGTLAKTLKPHPRLNGAYYFEGLPPTGVAGSSSKAGTDENVKEYETLDSTIMTSEVNNPWVFNAEGENVVGTGEISGIASNTKALSQGQFGQHPLIVFTSEGIYALGTSSEGLYSTNYPLSREVCNNPKSITPTDGAMFFTSEKGLMMMVGSEITCVSQQMMGKTNDFNPNSLYGSTYSKEAVNFHAFLKNCIIAYDYRDSCLYLINSSYGYHYVYDIKSGSITRSNSRNEYLRVVNDYPDNLLQDSKGTVWSLIDKPEVNADDATYSGILLSRPIKFADAQTLKSLRQVMHVMDLHDGASVTLHIYVSNELKHWGELKSLRGMGWKYFRFGLVFSELKATDSYSGLLAITQNRRTDKLR